MTLAPEIELPATGLSADERRRARRAGLTLGVLGAGSIAGTAFSFYLVNHFPLLLIALSPLGRHLVLVAPIVDPVAFLVVSIVRRMWFYKASYDLGGALGDRGFVWLEQRARVFAYWVRWLERVFARWSRLVVLVMAGPTISVLAGVSGMARPVFLSLAFTSLFVRMLLILGVAELLRGPIEIVLAWIDAHWKTGTALMVVAVLAYQWIRIRRSRRGDRAA